MAKKTTNVKRISKADIYAEYGVQYENGKILSPLFGFINPLLVDGNEKIGKSVYHFSTLAGNAAHTVKVCGHDIGVLATCNCNCPGCYAQRGNYNYESVEKALAIRTVLARLYPDFVKRAILAQIRADKVQFIRIHASGDFFNAEYIAMWHDVIRLAPGVVFWTYTKNPAAENAFDDLDNINIVRSIIPGIGINYGHADYIMSAYRQLKAAGENVYICRCGIDKNQHCNDCKGCSRNEYVLFLEHSTGYKPEKDPVFSAFVQLVDSQEKPE